MVERESGYYWVLTEDGWEVDYFDAEVGAWLRVGLSQYREFDSGDFLEIDEKRLER